VFYINNVDGKYIAIKGDEQPAIGFIGAAPLPDDLIFA
jgi:hypothetical protein